MTSVTYGMRKSLCKVTFDMYQGALANFLNVYIIILLHVSVVRPSSGSKYILIARITQLTTNGLFVTMEILFIGLLLGYRFGNLWEDPMEGSHNTNV
jgi:hypothetical protein